ncbi:hypothetical protein H6P81_013774 [Aristolochia fimbriata]|uniref:Reverse transcriptase Ty1/copia-type domain-containing protein n=1 Tax=Aristolochia fimbriata TaxID=158543 RepID=A0AAV7EIX5_ARIFI|nr:hypothetical protein H6P81_013774 [Aristolochia fimbriata]
MATSMDIAQIVPMKLDDTNYVHWASIVRTFLKGQNLWKYVTSACPLPVLAADNSNLKAVDEWEINNSKALTLLVSSVSSSINFQIGKFDCAHDAWVFLKKLYMSTNFAQIYKLAMDLHSLRQMPNQSISDFYAQMSFLCDQLANMDPKFEYEVDIVIFQKYIEEAHLVQFFMALRDEYDSIRPSMLHKTPLPSVESALSELLAEETRRLTRGPFSSSLGGIDTVFGTSSQKSSASSECKSSTTRDMSKVKCNYCKEFGHMKFTCPKLKKSPHSTSTRHTTAASASQGDPLPSQPSTSASPIPTFGDIKEMINKALIGLGQGTFSASALSASSGIGPVNGEVAFDIFPDDSSPLFSPISDSVASLPSNDILSPSPPAVDVHVPSSASSSEPIPPLSPDIPPSTPRQSSRIRRPSVKTKADGSIDRHKARLVTKGYNQEYDIDYEETFAPVARLTSVRVLIAIDSIRRWDLFKMDVKNAFLNGALIEEVYMVPPPGSSHPSGQVCRLRRALYELKQAPCAWFSTFYSKIIQFGYTQSSLDSALFTRQSSSRTVLLLLYVDDMIITGDDIQGISDLKRYLRSCFEMKNLGQLRYFLGLEVLPFDDGYGLSQVKYASDLLNRAGLSDSKVCDSLTELNAKFWPADGELLSAPTLYRQLVGGLLYLTISRPDICYAVHVVGLFMSTPRSVHYATVLRILRYIKGSLF